MFAEGFPPADGPSREISLGTPSAFRGHRSAHVPVEKAAQRQAVVDDVATHGLQVLNLTRTLAGLDRLPHARGLFPYRFAGLHPRGPQSLADDLRRVLQGRPGVNEAHVDQLVAHLRACEA